ncbi:hypothetical protein CUJ83_07835 [Methanocella sp. CWC-04]|uniref:DUF354 domain-containing protein n=1 Tax=Methanooceanicella nereidis TaxID=2052831 RepID=A0AAP2RDQ0_9EURY|nr:DUF354 domain-containing protein [Methanocella sp. CWC-04]MCD1294906.1 hypothetical protein [Methanocella sp. CWC-04]
MNFIKIVVDINHPADVHFFKDFIRLMRERGHKILITASKKDVSLELLDRYGLEYVELGSYGDSLPGKSFNIPVLDLKMYKAVRGFNPDLLLGLSSIRAPHVSFLLKKRSVNFLDTEHSKEQRILYMPFVNKIYTPACFMQDLGKKQVRYDGYKELAYLHPDHFTPDIKTLEETGLKKDEKYFIIRSVSWRSSHDIGQHGIRDIQKLIIELEKHGKVLLSSEGPLDNSLKKYRVNISPEKIHDLLYYAALYIGEGATMAAEAAVLGTPSIYISSLKGKLGYLNELEQRYGLLYSFNDQNEAGKKIDELLTMPDIKDMWKSKKEIMLSEKIDVNEYMIGFVEDYMKNNIQS